MAEQRGKHSIVRHAADARLDDETEEVLRGIESASPFVLRSSGQPEDLDPSDVGEPGMNAAGPSAGLGIEDDDAEHLDDPVEQIAAEVDSELAKAEAAAEADQAAQRRRRRLRVTLAVAVAILLFIAAVVGVVVWRDSMAPDVSQSDTEALVTTTAGSDSTLFQPVASGTIPDFAKLFGKKNKVVRERTQGMLVYDGAPAKAKSADVKAQRYLQEATLADGAGQACATVLLGLDAKQRLVYVYCLFDLDVLGVADADFKTLAGDETVARSVLVSMGVSDGALATGALASRDGAGQGASGEAESVTFAGGTGRDAAPRSWKLVETYDRSLGKKLGDNSVMRTIAVELR